MLEVFSITNNGTEDRNGIWNDLSLYENRIYVTSENDTNTIEMKYVRNTLTIQEAGGLK